MAQEGFKEVADLHRSPQSCLFLIALGFSVKYEVQSCGDSYASGHAVTQDLYVGVVSPHQPLSSTLKMKEGPSQSFVSMACDQCVPYVKYIYSLE